MSTIAVAAAIAVPMCIICVLIMAFIWWYQRRQREQQDARDAQGTLQRLEDEAVIPSGQTLKELMDMSTGRLVTYCATTWAGK